MRKLKCPTDGQRRPAKALCITARCALRMEENLRTFLTKHQVFTSLIA
jgi:hypothetical protein